MITTYYIILTKHSPAVTVLMTLKAYNVYSNMSYSVECAYLTFSRKKLFNIPTNIFFTPYIPNRPLTLLWSLNTLFYFLVSKARSRKLPWRDFPTSGRQQIP